MLFLSAWGQANRIVFSEDLLELPGVNLDGTFWYVWPSTLRMSAKAILENIRVRSFNWTR